MSEQTEPWSAEERRILDLAAELSPPADVEQRVFKNVLSSIGAVALVPPPAPASPAAPVAKAVLSAKAAVTVAGITLVTGVGGGVLLGRSVLAPAAPGPTIVERVVRVEVPVPTAPLIETPPAPAPERPTRKPAMVVQPQPPTQQPQADELLAQERELIETARSALIQGNAVGALAALQGHAQRFGLGRLDEERESLWVQALVMQGALREATAKAQQFHQQFPQSLLGPTVDAAINAPR
jgi:hypothetical protein